MKNKIIGIFFLMLVLILTSIVYSQNDIVLTKGDKSGNIYSGYTFADNIISHNGREIKSFSKEKALNGVFGAGDEYGSLDVFVIGDGKEAVFEWKGKKIVNGAGADFKVFENGFYIGGGDTRMSLDLGIVEVSKDGKTWHRFPVSYDDTQFKNSIIGKNGFIGLKPVYLNMKDNFINPSEVSAGGDAFDLSDVDIEKGDSIKYIKLIDAGDDYSDGQIASNGIDIDGVCAFYWSFE